ncbi:hypothetical protein MMC17_005834 [Xylographa soralifera]|nr:hypothetical protein [Xylographa soralifera]
MPNDSATSRFLYTILKQLDHKSVVHPRTSPTYSTDILQIDWNTVASDLEITNGHAARMRFSRFKQHMEGIPPTPRKPRSEVRQHKRVKTEKNAKAVGKRPKTENSAMKYESMDQQLPTNVHDEIDNGFNVKDEPFPKLDPFLEPEPLIKPESSIKPEPLVKEEPMDDWLYAAEETDPPVAGLSSVALTNGSPSFAEQPITKPSTPPGALPELTQILDHPAVLKLEPHSRVKLESPDTF